MRQPSRSAVLTAFFVAGCSSFAASDEPVAPPTAANDVDATLADAEAVSDVPVVLDVAACDLTACPPAPPCRVQACGPAGACVTAPAPDGTPCDDGVACTASDFCGAGTCVGGGPRRFTSLFGAGQGARFQGVVPTGDGGFLVAGNHDFAAGTTAYDPWLVRLDATGAALWQKTLGTKDSDGLTALVPAGDSYVAAGFLGLQAALLRFDLAGNIAWQKTYSPVSTFDALATAGPSLVAGGAQFQGKSAIAWVHVVDGQGAVTGQWQLAVPGFMAQVRRVAVHADGRIAGLGFTRQLTASGQDLYDIWLVHLDPAGKLLQTIELATQVTGSASGLLAMPDGSERVLLDVAAGGSWDLRLVHVGAAGQVVATTKFPSGSIQVPSLLLPGPAGALHVVHDLFGPQADLLTILRVDAATGQVLASHQVPAPPHLKPRPFAAAWLGGGAFVLAGDVALPQSPSAWTTARALVQRLEAFDAPDCGGEACLGDTHGCLDPAKCQIGYCDGVAGCKAFQLPASVCSP